MSSNRRGPLEWFAQTPPPYALPHFDLWKDVNDVAQYPGVYVVLGPGATDHYGGDAWGMAYPVYVGESVSIRRRLKSKGHPIGPDGCAYLTTKVPRHKDRLYLESLLVGLYRPLLNWSNKT